MKLLSWSAAAVIFAVALFQVQVGGQGVWPGDYVYCMITAWVIYSDGVSLSLGGTAIANDGYVDVDDIGFYNDHALLCHTDKTDCCRGSNTAGDWYFPDRTRVGSNTENINLRHTRYFFRNRDNSVVRLRRREAPTERGRFYCEVPNASDVNQTIYVNIGKLKCFRCITL